MGTSQDLGQHNADIDRIKQQFSDAAPTYDANAALQQKVGEALMSRLQYLGFTPARVLDLGAGTGYLSLALQKHFPKAQIISLDLSEAMLRQMKRPWFGRCADRVVGDMQRIPLKVGSIDLVFANQTLHWAFDLGETFRDIAQVLSPQGGVVFSTLGPDTFRELRTSWQQVDDNTHTMDFIDMHDIADLLIRNGFAEPVVDMDYLTLRYRDTRQLGRDLKAQGVQMIRQTGGMTTPRQWQKFSDHYDELRDAEGWLPLTYEVIYGVAWRAKPRGNRQETFIPVSSLKSSSPT